MVDRSHRGWSRTPPIASVGTCFRIYSLSSQPRQPYLEGESHCRSPDEFAVDFDDRGLGGRSDDTDWGRKNGASVCGETVDPEQGAWYLWYKPGSSGQRSCSDLPVDSPSGVYTFRVEGTERRYGHAFKGSDHC
eukprot:SAG22_NODE_8458_length_654_cov_1.318919_1_plen_133_part_10